MFDQHVKSESPMKQSGIELFRNWVKKESFSEVFLVKTVDEKAMVSQNVLRTNCDKFLPIKIRKISTEDQPFCAQRMKYLKRKKNREYKRTRCSQK